MDIFWDSVEIIVVIFLLLGTGMLMSWKGWIEKNSAKFISKFVVSVALPCAIFNTMYQNYDAKSLLESLPGLAIAVVSVAVMVGLGWVLGGVFKVPQNRRGVFAGMFSFSNSIFIGLPICQTLFGDPAVPYAMVYYISNTIVFWVLGYPLMQKDAGGGKKMPLKELVKKILSVPLITFFVAFALIAVRVKMPGFVMKTAGYLNNVVTPLSLIYTGHIFCGMIRGGRFHWEKSYVLVMLARFVIGPALFLGLTAVLPIVPEMRSVMLLQAAMPVMTQVVITSGAAGADDEYAAGGLILTTALCVLTIPVYRLLIG